MTITDLSPETVELLLQYCYGCLHKMPTDHTEVITAALCEFLDICQPGSALGLLAARLCCQYDTVLCFLMSEMQMGEIVAAGD